VETAPDPLAPQGLRLTHRGSVEDLAAFRDGLFHVQDTASQLCCALLDAQPGETVYDLCAAPGGKSFTLAQDAGQVCAFDQYEARVSLIAQGAARLGLRNIQYMAADARETAPERPQANKVLCDVPCSGLGILRRKPEIRYKNASDLDKLPDLQYSILHSASGAVKPGGLLVYSTCTLNPAENEQLCARFLEAHGNFTVLPVFPELPRAGAPLPFLTLMPQLHGSDGFFLAAFRKHEET